MIYYYIFKIKYKKGKTPIIKNYLVSFNDIYDFMCFLEFKHGKSNYVILNIRQKRNFDFDYYNFRKEVIL